TCVSSSGTPVAGSGGCPAGAAVSNQSSFVSALRSSLSGQRVLFKCGDTFTGDNAVVQGITFSVGAYGSCVGTTSGRPIFSDSGSTGEISIGSGSGATYDGRISDLDLEGNSSGYVGVAAGGSYNYYQITLNNLLSHGNTTNYDYYNDTQWGLIEVVASGQGATVGTFINDSENQCVNGNQSYNCGGTPNFVNVSYNAVMGGRFDGTGAPNNGHGIETFRVSACRLCVFANNTFENANNIGATFKLHSGNPNSQNQWIGQYTELVEISDNLFTGTSGAQLVEIAPQNNETDERLRNIVFERNLVYGIAGNSNKLLVSVHNGSFRNNAFNGTVTSGVDYGIQIAQRGSEYTPSANFPCSNAVGVCPGSAPVYIEVYNNTCYVKGGNGCIGFDGANFIAPANSSWAANNMMYNSSGGTTVRDSGSGNAVSNNTASAASDPGFADVSGTYKFLSDYLPTANYAGGISVANFFDALGEAWSPTWDLGAVHH
ncbi:MAG TPA: hypothetical protein VGE92_02010, partial [Steroidobacteraceae bacterium]